MSSGFTYVASPFSHEDPLIRARRYYDTLAFLAWAHERNMTVYSPIAHWGRVADLYDLRTDHDAWRVQNMAMLHASRGVIVLALDDQWEASRGIEAEVEAARDRLPVEFWRRVGDAWKQFDPKMEAA